MLSYDVVIGESRERKGENSEGVRSVCYVCRTAAPRPVIRLGAASAKSNTHYAFSQQLCLPSLISDPIDF